MILRVCVWLHPVHAASFPPWCAARPRPGFFLVVHHAVESKRRWLKPFLSCLGHKARRRMCPLYVFGTDWTGLSQERPTDGGVGWRRAIITREPEHPHARRCQCRTGITMLDQRRRIKLRTFAARRRLRRQTIAAWSSTIVEPDHSLTSRYSLSEIR